MQKLQKKFSFISEYKYKERNKERKKEKKRGRKKERKKDRFSKGQFNGFY